MEPLAMPEKFGVFGMIAIVVILLVFTGLVIFSSEWRWVIGSLVTVFGTLAMISHRQWKRLEKERAGDSICRFARTLPARDHDTWIVRAVYEGLSSDRGFGIRPLDRLEEDLLFLPEDFEELACDIAKRARRSMKPAEQNPLTNRVVTVLDLIQFLEGQPELASGLRNINC